jgi:hypothetical protein
MGHCVQDSGSNIEQHAHVIRTLFRKRVVYGFKPLLKYEGKGLFKQLIYESKIFMTGFPCR